ncbi:MAG TPA: transcriptional repressor LexA [Gammaproteobacteria bacterium]
MENLTPSQTDILAFIRQSITETRRPPTMREIAQHMGYRSDNSAYQHLVALQRKGVLELDGRSRGINLLLPQGLPLIGRVAAGAPLLAVANIEDHLDINPDMFRPRADFLLRVVGMSMRDAGILDGDLLAVHKTAQARDKQIVVARLDDEVTVKRLRRRGNSIILQPENPQFKPIKVIPGKTEFVLEGLVSGVIRR